MTKQAYMVIFDSPGPWGNNLCQMRKTQPADRWCDCYAGEVFATSPDDAMHFVAEKYRAVRVRKCYPLDKVKR